MVSSSDPRDVVRAYYEAMSARDAAAVLVLFTDDAVSEDVPYGVPVGRLRLSQTLPAFFDAYPSLRYACRRLLMDGETVVAEYEVTNPHAGEGWRMRGVAIFEVRAGRIARHTAYWDEKTFRQGLKNAE